MRTRALIAVMTGLLVGSGFWCPEASAGDLSFDTKLGKREAIRMQRQTIRDLRSQRREIKRDMRRGGTGVLGGISGAVRSLSTTLKIGEEKKRLQHIQSIPAPAMRRGILGGISDTIGKTLKRGAIKTEILDLKKENRQLRKPLIGGSPGTLGGKLLKRLKILENRQSIKALKRERRDLLRGF